MVEWEGINRKIIKAGKMHIRFAVRIFHFVTLASTHMDIRTNNLSTLQVFPAAYNYLDLCSD